MFRNLLFILSLTSFTLIIQCSQLIYKNSLESPSDISTCVGKLVVTPNNINQHLEHSGMIVTDPLGDDQSALTFSKITDSGDLFCGEFEAVTHIGICVEYFGKISTNAESGGFLGLSKNYQNDVNWFFGASKHGYQWGSRIYKTMTDNNKWTEYCMNKTITPDSQATYQIAIEDWNFAGTTTKDVYFRNLRVYDYDSVGFNEQQGIQDVVEQYAIDDTKDKPYNRYKLTWEYLSSEQKFHFKLLFPLPDTSGLWQLEEYELGVMVALFPYEDNSTSVSLIEDFNPLTAEGNFEQYIEQDVFEEHYPCVVTSSNQRTCYGQIYFFPKKIGEYTQYALQREAVQNQLLRYDFEIQTTRDYTATESTNNQSFSYNLTVKTLISDIPCEKSDSDNECIASVILDASTYYTFTYCESFDDCSQNHTSEYIYGDTIVIQIESKIGEHEFDIYSMYVYYPVAEYDTVGNGYELPRDDIILQEKTSTKMKYTYTISQQAGYFQGDGKSAKLKILMNNVTEDKRRLLTDTTEVMKYDYAITVNEDTSAQTGATNGWNDVFEVMGYIFMGINIALLMLLVALTKRWYDIKQSIKIYQENQENQNQNNGNQIQEQEDEAEQQHQDPVIRKDIQQQVQQYQQPGGPNLVIQNANYMESQQYVQQVKQENSTLHDQESQNGNQ